MQFNHLQSYMPRSAAAERKEQNCLRHSQVDDGFIWLENECKKNSDHSDPIEELGEGELVNQSAT